MLHICLWYMRWFYRVTAHEAIPLGCSIFGNSIGVQDTSCFYGDAANKWLYYGVEYEMFPSGAVVPMAVPIGFCVVLFVQCVVLLEVLIMCWFCRIPLMVPQGCVESPHSLTCP